jgi:protein kinase
MIDEGAFGIVTKCRDRETGEIVAVKKMKQRTATFDECLQMKEVKSLRKIKHDNVMRLLQVFRENDRLFLVFEFLPDGSLLQTMRNHAGPFTEPEVRFIVSHIFEGLAYCHRRGFFHRDIKPERPQDCGLRARARNPVAAALHGVRVDAMVSRAGDRIPPRVLQLARRRLGRRVHHGRALQPETALPGHV